MSKIKYLIKCIIHLDYKNMFKICSKVKKKSHKPFLYIFVDMIICGIKYQAGYYDYQEFEFYNLNKQQRSTYLTRGINNQIIHKYNQKDAMYKLDDKIVFNKLFDKYLNRDWLDIRECTLNQLDDFLKKHNVVIAKPVDQMGGKGIEKYEYQNNAEEIFKLLNEKKQYLVEQWINQHPEVNQLYPNAVNTLRMHTFNNGQEVYYLHSAFKIGDKGANVDNFASGGMITYVDQTGKVICPAYNKDDDIFYHHPVTNASIVDFKIPMFDQAIQLVKQAAKEIPEIGYIGWDVAISDKGPVIIEGNCYPGVFQMKPSFSLDKQGLLANYRKYMDIFR